MGFDSWEDRKFIAQALDSINRAYHVETGKEAQ
jgi:hypothetical protein